MNKLKPYSASLLALSGVLITGMGLYFIFIRPPLLPEDLHYMKTTSSIVQDSIPGLSIWLQKVFLVMGGYIFTSGLVILFIARTSFRKREGGSFSIATISGISSIGLMTVVNFIIESDFKITLLVFALVWVASIVLYLFHK